MGVLGMVCNWFVGFGLCICWSFCLRGVVELGIWSGLGFWA